MEKRKWKAKRLKGKKVREMLKGKEGNERLKGKKPTVLGVEFGEKVLYKIKGGQKLQKLEPR